MEAANSEAQQGNSKKRKHSNVQHDMADKHYYPHAPQPTVYHPSSTTHVPDAVAYGPQSHVVQPTNHLGYPPTLPYLPGATWYQERQSAYAVPPTYDGSFETNILDPQLHAQRTAISSHYGHQRLPLPAVAPSREVINLVDDDINHPYIQPSVQSHVPQRQYSTDYSLPPQGTHNNPLDIPSSPEADAKASLPRKVPNLSRYAHQPQPAAPNPILPPNGAKPDDPAADVVPILEPVLCKEQADLVDLILSRRNVFYTGSAGCGKSTVLKDFVKRFRERGLKVDIVAPTGRAALDINGSTTWTYAGWTPDHHKKPLKELRAAGHGKFVRKRMKETDVLVVDEISMVENLHFERLNAVMKEARNNEQAFGGVQLIVTGDFCQLPPVKPFAHCIECGRELAKYKDGAEYKCRMHGTYYDIDKWAFRSKAWQECNFAHVNLTNIHRQSDTVFIDILQKLRIGNPLLPKDRDLLLNHTHQTRNAIMLFSTREEVKRVNDDMFNKLRTQPRTYACLDHFKWNEKHGNLQSKKNTGPDGRSLMALRDHRYDTQIQLKKGMLVVLLHNLDIAAGLVNGSQGTIQGFEDYDPTKIPKAVGKGKDRESDPTHVGPLLAGDFAAFREQQIKAYIEQASYKKWPIVTFLNGVTRTIFADCTVNELGDEPPYSLLSRTQIPVMAAWAMTTHKSQGMTLNRVRVDLAKAFEEGQAYVALSRARSLNGLEVISLPSPEKMGSGNPEVKEFLREKFGI